MDQTTALAMLIFVLAILYSSVGHAGASGYLAAMALMNVAPEIMKPSALFLNLIVGTIATVRFARAGYFSWAIFWPFAVTSIPFSFLGGAIRLPNHLYKAAVGAVLLFAAARLIYSAAKNQELPTKRAPLLAAIAAGAAIGLLAGLTGTGGGIFLSPLLLLANWASMRETAGVSAAFVLTNSIAGLAGNLASVQYLPPQILLWGVVAGVGGIIGSELGSRRVAPTILKYLLAAVLVIAGCKMILLAFPGYRASALHRETPKRAAVVPTHVKSLPWRSSVAAHPYSCSCICSPIHDSSSSQFTGGNFERSGRSFTASRM